MKIKTEYLNKEIHIGKRSIIISDVVDESTMQFLSINFPNYLEEQATIKEEEDVASEE